jgi:membrane protein DedA with SNARE-associated domain/membrane-associated phospholipid phosphatase
MTEWIEYITSTLSAHPHWAGLVVFLVAAAEAVVVIGYILPGTLVLLAVGGVIGAGHLPLLPVLAWAAAGAVAGDGFSYWLGYRYRDTLRSRWPFNRRPDLLQQAEDFFHRHGGKSVAIGRFVPVLKPVIPVVAGILGMPPGRFYTVNILSALVWAPVHILPGVLAGASLKLLHGVSPRLALALLGMVLTLLLAWWASRLAVTRLAPLLRTGFDRLYGWTQSRPGSRLQRLAARFDPARPATLALLGTLTVLMLALAVFFKVLEDVITRDSLVRADHAINIFLGALRNPWTDPFLIGVTSLGDTLVTGAMALLLVGWMLLQRRWRLALSSTLALAVAAAGVPLLKGLIQVSRPQAMYTGFDAFSFPSGHTTMTAAVYGLLAWILAGGLRLRWRPVVYTLALGWMLLMAFSRVYLGAHWPSDVLAGLGFGLLAPATLAAIHHGYPRPRLRPALLAPAAAALLLVLGGWHVEHSREDAVARYLPQSTTEPFDVAAWRQGEDGNRTISRVDLAGELEEPLVLQWLGTPRDLEERLRNMGWSPPPPWSWTTATAFLRPASPVGELPTPARLHQGRAALLTLSHPHPDDPDARWVLRAWASGYRDAQSDRPLLVGSLVEERALHPAGILTLERSQPASSARIVELLGPIGTDTAGGIRGEAAAETVPTPARP